MKNDIGVGAKPPSKQCEDSNCPWHGSLPVRGRVFGCVVVSSKPHMTVIAEREYPHLIPKYQSHERRKSRIVAHNPPCISAKEGERVLLAECRTLSKTKHFVVVSRTGGKEE